MVTITEQAALKIKEVLVAQNKEDALLRLYLAGMGCSGPNFGMTLDESKGENDVLDEAFGVSVITDKSLEVYLEGAVIDYIKSSQGEGFEIRTAKSNNGGCDSGCCGGCGGSC
ncbi:Iron-sulfur cluster assembly accessory protein [Desulfosporosinus orientis DSM 765]|uniref:Iron-sulfur cluster assembly accessory protein n=1 Tax=Desulfosporosinus orientis (strain ATCC 19365 / DSM 765 / NCIMB 8382 / VKM B-1628 / Singapore I) TaxID=768706 RepID=G7W7L1_DESOD|nr:iron-sulfur cluster assembly accessory protein [Desulfosporosinus orientis]AET65930.1 Iron-sulfur cluster assembly accessory protein [Desulfosporosinus orientis DSM 765]